MISKVSNTVSDVVKSKEAWRWGIGTVFAIPIISWFLIQGATDREYMRETFTDTQNKLATSLDNLGDAIEASTTVNEMMLVEFKSLARETDDVGDEMRAQVKQFERFLKTIERVEYAKPVIEE